jgi:hypothetical protein
MTMITATAVLAATMAFIGASPLTHARHRTPNQRIRVDRANHLGL